MRRLILISIDLLLVAFATIVAVMLRGNFGTAKDSLITLTPYISISIGCAFFVFSVGGVDRTPWRYSSVADHLQIIVLTVLVILLALVLTFAVNRLEPVARSLPVLQGALIVTILVAVRSGARLWFISRIDNKANGHTNEHLHETILVVGVNPVSELYLLSVQEFASQQVRVAGVVAEEPKMRRRTIRQNPILGVVEELQEILQTLEVHGVTVDRIVVATARDRLLPRALETLLEVEKASNIIVQFLSEQLGFENFSQSPSVLSGRQRNSVHGQKASALLGNDVDYVGKSFRFLKRTVDGLGAMFLILTLAPVTALVALVVALDVGFPVIFWQQRPGLFGRPFKLYKFRTMRAPHDKHSNRIPDDERLSAVGRLLRRARLDELPQLYNVLIGDMSFIGPRPLLPRDQSPDYTARLSVRPGITGWAQVNGGRIISGSDKWILDIWYVHNASFVLDLKIVIRTVQMLLFGDRINSEAVYRARSDLDPTAKTLLRTDMTPAE